jgi:hypothetical protein
LKVTIFEAANHARKEIVVGATALSMNALIAKLRVAPLPAMASWGHDGVQYRSLEFEVDAAEAAGYIERHAATRAGWRVMAADRIID